MKVRDIMTAQPKAAAPNTTLSAAAQLLWGADCGIWMNDLVLAAGAGKAVRNDEMVETLQAICAHHAASVTAAA